MFETLLQQFAVLVTTTTTNVTTPVVPVVATNPTVESFQAIVVAVASIIGTAGAILYNFSQRGQMNNQKAAIRSAADLMKAFSGHMIQSKEDIKSLAEVTYEMMPDKAKEIINQQNIRILELSKKVDAANAQLSKLPEVLDHI